MKIVDERRQVMDTILVVKQKVVGLVVNAIYSSICLV